MKEYRFEIAVSYASEQLKQVERTVNFLKKYKVNIFFTPERQDDLIVRNILDELTNIYSNQSKYILAFISKEYMTKDITKNELSIALSRNKKGDFCLLPVYMDETRPLEINSDLYYFDFAKESEFSLAEKIASFIKHHMDTPKIEENLALPSNAIIFLSGATGVGKTTTARKLLEMYPNIIVMEEIDLIREALRCNTENMAVKLNKFINDVGISTEIINEHSLLNILDYDLLSKSTSDLNYNEMISQAKCICEPIKRMCWRLREKRLPAILEGVNLPFEALFTPFDSNKNYFIYSSNMLFVNLYLKNEQEHKKRIKERAVDRGLSEEILDKIMEKFQNIREQNQLLHEKAIYYSQKFQEFTNTEGNRVFSIDISGNPKLSIDENTSVTIKKISALIEECFTQ